VALGPKGGAGETWWSLQALKKPAPPDPKDAAKWVRNAIDQFILATLQEKGLTPSEPADRATLIRRVTYDLTGLPPTVEEVDAFVKDAAPDAYEKLVDRLLAIPRYGRALGSAMARPGPLCRHARLRQGQAAPVAWLYRDWVIRAFHADMPYRDLCGARSPAMCCFRAIRTASSPRDSWSPGHGIRRAG